MKQVNHAAVQRAQRKVGDQLEAERLERIRVRDQAKAAESNRWRLKGWNAEKEVVADTTITGDRNLDVALRSLELNPKVARTAVTWLT